jgi:chromate transport protein ChrA
VVHRGLRWVEPAVRSVSVPAAFVVAGLVASAAWDLADSLRPGGVEVAAILVATWLAGARDTEPLWLVLGAAAVGLATAAAR